MKLFTKIHDWLNPPEIILEHKILGKTWRKGQGEWEGEIYFSLEDGTEMIMHIFLPGDASGPDSAFVDLIEVLKLRYETLLPTIITKLTKAQSVFKTEAEVKCKMGPPTLSIDFYEKGKPIIWALQYTLDTDEDGDMGYFIQFSDWSFSSVTLVD